MKIQLNINSATDTVTGTYENQTTSTINLKEKSAGDLFRSLTNQERKDLGFLPPAVRWISDNQRIIVFERPPSLQYVELAFDRKDYINSQTPVHGFNLPIPWTLYYVMFDEHYNPVLIRVYCRNEPLYGWRDQVYMLPLLNLYFNSNLCNPVHDVYEPCENLSEGVQQAYNMVWNSGWNLDLQDTVTHCMSRGIPVLGGKSSSVNQIHHYFKEWEKLSLIKVLETQWQEPKAQVNGENFPEDERVTFKYTLDHFCEEAGSLHGMNPREMMVKIINSFSIG
jgi:hypothetical protein